MLEVRNVSKAYGSVRAVAAVSLQLAPGELVALVGKSGCGKSTLLNLCGAMDFPSTGEIVIDNTATTGLPDAEITRVRREKIGFVFQFFQLLPGLSAIENVELPLLLAGRAKSREIARERLAWVDMHTIENRLPHQLSGGQQQRVAIARALANDPKYLMADEPTGNLDSATGAAIIDLLLRIANERQTGILMATHSEESAAAANRVIHMRDGAIVPA